jgi:energy-coupling factor transporter transmembrane protein EcfT
MNEKIRNWFFKQLGIQEEMKYGTPTQRNLLTAFSFSFILALFIGFLCFFLPFNINFGLIQGLVAGGFWTLIIFLTEKSLASGGSSFPSIFGRLFIAILFSTTTAFALGMGMDNEAIEQQITQNTDANNRSLISENIETIRERYDDKISELQEKAVEQAIDNPDNTTVQEVIKESIKQARNDRDLALIDAESRVNEMDYNFSFGEKLNVYWSMKENHFNIRQISVFVFEILPALLSLIFLLTSRNKG